VELPTPDYRTLCAELVKLVERCPVTSDLDWICDRNDLIVQFRRATDTRDETAGFWCIGCDSDNGIIRLKD
jgi:hypothetical protein